MSDKQTTYIFTQQQLQALIEAAVEHGGNLQKSELSRANQRKGDQLQHGTCKPDCMERLDENYRWKPHKGGGLISVETGKAVTLESVYRDLMDFSDIKRDTAKKYVSEWRLKDVLEPFDGDLPALWEKIRRLSGD